MHPLCVNCLSTVHSVRPSRYPVTQSHWPLYGVLAHYYLKYDCQFQFAQKENPLNTELNPICHLLALLGANDMLHISRIRVNLD